MKGDDYDLPERLVASINHWLICFPTQFFMIEIVLFCPSFKCGPVQWCGAPSCYLQNVLRPMSLCSFWEADSRIFVPPPCSWAARLLLVMAIHGQYPVGHSPHHFPLIPSANLGVQTASQNSLQWNLGHSF